MPRRIWALADTHLSFADPKPMDIFGSHWAGHAERIAEQSRKLIAAEDIFLLPGDISWAMKRSAANVDLTYITSLPGIKVLCKGNHDYWWDSDKRLNFDGLHDTPYALPDNSFGVAGTRGWFPINTEMSNDEKNVNNSIITREVSRLRKRLEAISECSTKYVIVHYPPLEEFLELIEQHKVSVILYGHLHLSGSTQPLPDGWHGLRCLCVAADRINFTPKLIETL